MGLQLGLSTWLRGASGREFKEACIEGLFITPITGRLESYTRYRRILQRRLLRTLLSCSSPRLEPRVGHPLKPLGGQTWQPPWVWTRMARLDPCDPSQLRGKFPSKGWVLFQGTYAKSILITVPCCCYSQPVQGTSLQLSIQVSTRSMP